MTAQGSYLAPFTGADYNTLRALINSPDNNPTDEVNLFDI
jgi:hypothetical protein